MSDEGLAKTMSKSKELSDLPPATEEKAVRKMEAVTIEERQFGVSGEVRDDIARLWDDEIRRLRYCPLNKIQHRSKFVEDDPRQCRFRLTSFDGWIVHHQLHLMTQADSRVQKQTNAQSFETVHPMSEKTMRAALGPEERKRMLKEPEVMARIQQRRELARE